MEPLEISNRQGSIRGIDYTSLQALATAATPAASLTLEQREEAWTTAVDLYQSAIMSGHASGKTLAGIVEWIWEHVPNIAKSRGAIRRQLYRKIAQLEKRGNVSDQRREANKRKRVLRLSREDRRAFLEVLISARHYGEVDAAWRDCVKNKKVSEALLQRYPASEDHRDRCPKSIRRQFSRRLIQRALDLAYRPRKAAQSGPFSIIRHDGYHAGDWRTCDDFTLEVYFAPPAGDPCPLRKGQFLPVADCRSKKILHFALINAEGYRQDDIRILWKKDAQANGLPRCGWHAEAGLWKRGRLLGGKVFDSLDEDKRNFAERLGRQIRNSLPASPRGKIIENIGKLLQRYVRAVPRWVGPDEKKLVFEHSQRAIRDVLAGRKTAAEAGFLTREELTARLADEIIPEYNSTKQDSRVMGGDKPAYMSPDEAWEGLQPRDAADNMIGVEYLPENLEWLFHHREVVNVGRNGIRLPYCGGLNYKGGLSGADWAIGHTVIAYFDPEHTERIHISDMKMEQWGIVPLDTHVDRWNAAPYDLAAAKSRIREHDGAARLIVTEIKSRFRPPPRRIIADVQSVEIGQQMKHRERELALHASGAMVSPSDRLRRFYLLEAPDMEPANASRTKANIRTVREFLED
jgi:DNA-binding MarR family transcriptional regulator